MQIKSIFVSNFLGLCNVDIDTSSRVTLFAGRNGAGKSSLRDAIALALTADLGRVSLKKEVGALIHDGTESAVCEVVDADGDQYGVTLTAAGKMTDTRKGKASNPMLAYVLDAQRFTRLELNDRRAFLFGLMGVKTDGKAITERLIKRELDAKKIERIAPLLRSGFPAACAEAKSKATEAKGAWRQVTGETYGSEKGKTWRAAVPASDAALVAKLTTELKHADVAVESWQQSIGQLQAEETRHDAELAKLPVLQQQADKVDRIAKKLATDEEQLAGWEADLIKTAAAAGAGPRVGLLHDLANALHALLRLGPTDATTEGVDAMHALQAYEAEHGKIGGTGDPKARERLASIRQSRDLMASAVSNGKRDLAAAQKAKEAIATIKALPPLDPELLQTARSTAETLKKQRADIIAKLDAQKAQKAQADAAKKKTEDAAAHHIDVQQWDAIGDALAPDGIPGEILSEALGPMNERLAQSAVDADWLRAAVGPDMAITGNGRAYRLLSESEQWRIDAMFAEAIAHLSGTRLLVLDRFDVLDPLGRAQLLGWLDVLADTGEVDSALIFGTLKSLPTSLPSTIATHWIENGVVAQLKEAA